MRHPSPYLFPPCPAAAAAVMQQGLASATREWQSAYPEAQRRLVGQLGSALEDHGHSADDAVPELVCLLAAGALGKGPGWGLVWGGGACWCLTGCGSAL